MPHRTACCLLLTLLTGCSVFGGGDTIPVQNARGDDVVCVIMNDKKFKRDLVENLRYVLDARGYTVVTVDRKYAAQYDPADFAAVVYIAEYRFWRVPGDAKEYYRRSRDTGNVVFVITAANADLEITEPFDAITTASQSWKLHGVNMELTNRLNRILDR